MKAEVMCVISRGKRDIQCVLAVKLEKDARRRDGALIEVDWSLTYLRNVTDRNGTSHRRAKHGRKKRG